ncbi:hypothetical protein Gotri_026131, partial [Gossypium trilobum]|nr:hypothetical protein [Gossypium trilobum]
DSLSIIKKCRSNIPDKSKVCAYISDIHKLQSSFQECRFEHVPRAVSSLAHMIAKATLRDKLILYLVEGVPEYAEDQSEGTRRLKVLMLIGKDFTVALMASRRFSYAAL